MKPYYQDDAVTIYHGDCASIISSLPTVSLVVADPPYHKVIEEEWDRQWSSDQDFLSWLAGVVEALALALADNGTLYCFSSSRMAARVELLISESMRVVSSCVWDKGSSRMGAAGAGVQVEALRSYWTSSTERCTVAEKRPYRYEAADDAAKDASGYWAACERAKRSVFGDYLEAELRRAGITRKQIAALFPSASGGLTGCVSNWLLGYNCPTAAQYDKMRALLGPQYLRREYEDLRREYEDLRRPFSARDSHEWSELWRFALPRERRHPTEKPIGMLSQIIEISSRADDLILDPFMGSGTTLRAAKDLGRKAIGIEIDERYCEIAAKRMAQEVLSFT